MPEQKGAGGRLPIPAVLVLGLGGGLSSSFAFGKLADGPFKRQIGDLDHHLSDLARDKTGPVLRRVLKAATVAGQPAVLYPVSGLAAAMWLLNERPEDALVAALAVGGSAAVDGLVKRVVKRPRPMLRVFLGNLNSSSSSFPSNHATMSLATYTTLTYLATRRRKNARRAEKPKGRRLLAVVWAPVLLLCALIGWSRIYRGEHRPTDVLAGWMLGGIWAVTCAAILNALSSPEASAGRNTSGQ